MAFTDDFKERLNIAFVKSQITKRQFAKNCFVSEPTAGKWLNKAHPMMPGIDKLPLICNALGVSPSDLIKGGEGPNNASIAKARELARQAQVLVNDVADLLSSANEPSPSRRGKYSTKKN